MSVHAANHRKYNDIQVNVQRLVPDGGGESLNVKPQAYGGRKIPVLYKYRNEK